MSRYARGSPFALSILILIICLFIGFTSFAAASDYASYDELAKGGEEPTLNIHANARNLALALLGLANGDTMDYCLTKGDTRFNRAFRFAAAKYLPAQFADDWCAVKAMCHHESLDNPLAVSHAGAMGLCQVMESTWREWEQKLIGEEGGGEVGDEEVVEKVKPGNKDADNPRPIKRLSPYAGLETEQIGLIASRMNRLSPYVAVNNIIVAVKELRRNYDVWYMDRNYECHQEMAWACYSAGRGTVLSAQRSSGGGLCFDDIVAFLPGETQNYVPKIRAVIAAWKA